MVFVIFLFYPVFPANYEGGLCFVTVLFHAAGYVPLLWQRGGNLFEQLFEPGGIALPRLDPCGSHNC